MEKAGDVKDAAMEKASDALSATKDAAMEKAEGMADKVKDHSSATKE